MKSLLLRFYWVGFLLFSVGFFKTSKANIFEAGKWTLTDDVPGFDTAMVKGKMVPIDFYAFGNQLSEDGYYLLQIVAFFSALVFAFYLLRLMWNAL
ncbi:hypothetical protein [Hymenobacter terricola]|uniref:hypothetical protein n=1 Tax=Hymenobacter terricola TaxID=2819236 RepID=UPI001B315A7C|nr:hypothetical protein [Hymenobacter terricola]